MNQNHSYGILGQTAPKWEVSSWINENGELDDRIDFGNYIGKKRVLFFFQDWCQGCHTIGFPALKRLITVLVKNKNIAIFAIQTVFEGQLENTFDKLLVNQKKYALKIPFGHDSGDATTLFISKTMQHYQTRGTPWFVIIDSNGIVVFNDFHLNSKTAIGYLQSTQD
ncbi:thioredoxin-like domain-containing protein [Flavobacterium ovatum]|uniref:peroxiredoxin family protein n=1 Tax=Flavobacterium ovatum TaxID=1928857 RepID=UPI003450DD37